MARSSDTRAFYPIFVHRLARLLYAFFRPRLAARIVKNLNDGHRAIGKAEIILTSSLKRFRLDEIEVCCGLQKY